MEKRQSTMESRILCMSVSRASGRFRAEGGGEIKEGEEGGGDRGGEGEIQEEEEGEGEIQEEEGEGGRKAREPTVVGYVFCHLIPHDKEVIF